MKYPFGAPSVAAIQSVIDCYEAELLADIESDETVQRAIRAYDDQSERSYLSSSRHIHWDSMRAALRAAIEEGD